MKTVLAVATLLVTAASAAAAQSIQGVWKVVEWQIDSGPTKGRHTSDLQPGLLIFTSHYYSATAVLSFAPRAQLSDNPTDAEKAKAFGNDFLSHAGTYALRDSMLIMNPVVAKNPGYMSGQSDSTTFRVVADSLLLNGGHLKFVRVE